MNASPLRFQMAHADAEVLELLLGLGRYFAELTEAAVDLRGVVPPQHYLELVACIDHVWIPSS